MVPRVSTHSRPKAAAGFGRLIVVLSGMFQHTAARRRLPSVNSVLTSVVRVSTHSRPKAAAFKGYISVASFVEFQHTAARRRLPDSTTSLYFHQEFQHTAARRRLPMPNYVWTW